MRLYYNLLFFSLLFLAAESHAQTVDTIFGFDEIPAPELAYDDILIESFEFLYGNTFDYTASENAGWCSSIENDQYISFRTLPSGTGRVVFSIESFGCAIGVGLEVGLYDIHNELMGSCTTDDRQAFTFSNLTPGLVYYLRIDGNAGDNCEFLIQSISGINAGPAPSNSYLGRDTFCTTGCVTAPTGETITCASGLYAFEASNDTTYYGELFIDNSQELELGPFTYNWNQSTCEWFVDFSWIGSSSPFYLNGESYQNSFAQLGPFADSEIVSISLSGSSSCVDTLFTDLTFSCTSSTTSVHSLGFEIAQLNSSLLQITAPSFGWRLSIVDVLGREISTTLLNQDSNQLFVGDLTSGAYILVLEKGKERATEKWVKR